MADELHGKRVAILAADGVERVPNPQCVFPRSGFSTASAVRRGVPPSRGWGSYCSGSGTA
ncbi:hypothetical protein MyChFU_53590 [Mycobacterium intracellulare subsp. chimaera]|uniref:Uncharacterized protein n=1 Tax=Mycobacterium timonense TaxID=701043 RepID=A0A7I9ZDT6_9MYCO|nr:hypothetical protein MTIM_49520 [Mycobacterium timonense]